MRVQAWVGVDPGSSGAIAVIDDDLHVMGVLKLKGATDKEVLDWLNDPLIQRANKFGMIEKVHSFPKQGVASTFSFGKSFGGLLMALAATNIPFEQAPPGVWMRSLGLLKAGKNGLKAKAAELFPNVRVTLWNADALLLAYYARKVWKGES